MSIVFFSTTQYLAIHSFPHCFQRVVWVATNFISSEIQIQNNNDRIKMKIVPGDEICRCFKG